MCASEQIMRYGVKEQNLSGGPIEQAIESLRIVGFAVVDGCYTTEKQQTIASAFDRVQLEQSSAHGGRSALEELDEHNTIRAPLSHDTMFLELAQNPIVLAIVAGALGGSHKSGAFLLKQQNGVINPAKGGRYNQGSFHRDLPYQHFVSSRPLAVNALFCIDPFTSENGATLVIPGSHKEERFPSDAVVRQLARSVAAPAGHFIVLDCMVYHSGGANRTSVPRRAVNHVYTLPFMRQQIDIPGLLGYDRQLADDTKKLLGYGNESVRSVAQYYATRRAKMNLVPDAGVSLASAGVS
jgi:ectoine hydroxylase-related dioxygenase (phytanoyl-CoA dioxygenase family)